MRSRTAASSIANGMPSRRRASSTTAAWLSGVTSKRSAGLSRALDEQGDGLRLSDPVRRRWPIGVRDRERADLDDGFSCHAERLPAGGEDPQRRRLTEKGVGQQRAGVDQVLTVVEDEQQPLGGDVLDQPGDGPPARLIAQAERGHDRFGDELWVSQAGELHQPHAIRDPAPQVGRRPKRQAGLTDPTRPDEGHHAGAAQGRLDRPGSVDVGR